MIVQQTRQKQAKQHHIYIKNPCYKQTTDLTKVYQQSIEDIFPGFFNVLPDRDLVKAEIATEILDTRNTENTEKKARPIVKWVGGKRQLLNELISRMPETYGTYYEPFFGGGALFFALSPKKAVINDKNKQLMNLYRIVRDTPVSQLTEWLTVLQKEYNELTSDEERSSFYYAKRDEFNEFLKHGTLSFDSACLFLFMNKVAFNGVYRENSQGLYNVPTSKRKSVTLFDKDNLILVSEMLGNCELLTGDFEEAVKNAKSGDFAFIDSPYYETYSQYQKNGFSDDDHRRVKNMFESLTNRGVKCMLTNSDTDFMKDLYKDYNVETVNVSRNINRNGNDRKGKEIIVRNY